MSTTKIPVGNAGTTALGHNLLHVACMPANVYQIQLHSELIFRSIHETRDVDYYKPITAVSSVFEEEYPKRTSQPPPIHDEHNSVQKS